MPAAAGVLPLAGGAEAGAGAEAGTANGAGQTAGDANSRPAAASFAVGAAEVRNYSVERCESWVETLGSNLGALGHRLSADPAHVFG